MKAKCECTFNNLMSNDLISNLDVGGISEVISILQSFNLEVFKCIVDIFKLKYFKKCIGGFFILGLIIIQIGCIFSFLNNRFYYIRKHIISLGEFFSLYQQKLNFSSLPKKQKSKTWIKNTKRDSLENFFQSTNSKNQILNKISFERDKK